MKGSGRAAAAHTHTRRLLNLPSCCNQYLHVPAKGTLPYVTGGRFRCRRRSGVGLRGEAGRPQEYLP